MRLPALLFSALLYSAGWGIACSDSVALRPVPPVKTRSVQEVPLSTQVLPTPTVQTEAQSLPQSVEAKKHGEERSLVSEGHGNEEKHEEAAGEVPQIIGKHVAAYGFHEDEIGGHHKHGMVTLDGINLFVLRTGHVYKNPVERSTAIARRLEESLHSRDLLFILGKNEKEPAIYAVSHHGGYPRLIVIVTKGDARGYSSRNGRTVSQEELGQWWLGWLKDLVAVLFLNVPPSHLSVPHAEEVLILLGQRLHELSPEGPYTPVQISLARETLRDEARHYLQSVAFRLSGASLEEEIPWDEEHHH